MNQTADATPTSDQITVRADWDPKFFSRFLWIALGCVLMGSWFFYDAKFTYPHELERCLEYWSRAEDPKSPKRWIPMEEEKWQKLAESKGWSTKPPKSDPEEQKTKIGQQYFWGVLTTLIALPCFLKWFFAKNTWVGMTERGVKTSWGREFLFENVKSVDKSRWVAKGIAKVTIENGQRTEKFVMDDFKYLRQPMSDIMRAIESHLPPEQITGGPTEAERDEQRAKAEADRKKADEAIKAAAEEANESSSD